VTGSFAQFSLPHIPTTLNFPSTFMVMIFSIQKYIIQNIPSREMNPDHPVPSLLYTDWATLAKSRDSSVVIALSYGLDFRGSRVLFQAGAGNFSLHHRVQNGSGAHPASYLMGTRGSFPGDKAAGAWSWQLASVPVLMSNNAWSYTSTPPIRPHCVVLS
jgi:hypothetical protein